MGENIPNLSNGPKIYQIAVIYSKWLYTLHHSRALQNLPELGFFCLKMYHLATLVQRLGRPLSFRGDDFEPLGDEKLLHLEFIEEN
jgi:hypothetical protein